MKVNELLQILPQAKTSNVRIVKEEDLDETKQVDIKIAPLISEYIDEKNKVITIADKEVIALFTGTEVRKEVRGDGENEYTIICFFIVIKKEVTENDVEETVESNS